MIPLPVSHVHRTSSEIQLEHDEMVAKWRDYLMRQRLVTGMVQRCEKVGYHPKMANALENMMRTTAQDFGPSSEQSNIAALFDDDDDWFLGISCADASQDSWSLSLGPSKVDIPQSNENISIVGETNKGPESDYFYDGGTIFELEL